MKSVTRVSKLISNIGFEIPELPARDWKNTQNQSVKQVLIPVTSWLGFLFFTCSLSHIFLLNLAISLAMSIVTGVTAVLLFTMLLILQKINLPLSWVHPVGALLIILTVTNSLILINLSGDMRQSIYVMLIILGIAVFIVDHRWFFALILMTVIGWVISIMVNPSLELTTNSMLGILASVGLGIGFFIYHARSLKKLATSEYQERIRKSQLETIIKEMKSSNSQLLLNNSALLAAANGIAITDRDGNFIWANPAFTKITGFSTEEAIGKNPRILKSGLEDDAFYKTMWETITNGKVWAGKIINRRKDGTFYHEEQTITPVTDDKGEITHFIGIKQDISERVHAQEALERRNQELVQLNKAISIITSSLDLNEVEHNIVGTVKDILPQVYGATLQLMDEQGNLVTKTVSQYVTEQTPDIFFRTGVGATGIAVQERKLVNIGDVAGDKRFLKTKTPPPFKSLISIPIIYKDQVFGTLSVEGKISDAFGPQEERLLKLLADYAAAAIQNAQYSEHLEEMIKKRTQELTLAQEKLFAQQQLEQEIKLAVNVQESLLPHHMPELSGFSIHAAALPAHSVSGDFYDFVINKDHRVSLILADIAGKGVPAAMLTSTARSLIRISLDNELFPATALCEVNSRLYDDLTHAGMFITMLVVQINISDGKIKYANAGHTEALWWRYHEQSCQNIPVTGIPLGILKEFELGEIEIAIRPGDILLLYSDGITESTDPNDQLFGIKRLQSLLQENYEEKPEVIIDKIIDCVDEFCQGIAHSDDITMIILKALPRQVPFVFPAQLDQLDALSSLIRRNADAFGSVFAHQLELAASEIITNIIKHAYATNQGDIQGEISVFDERVEIDFFDRGATFDLSTLPEVDLDLPHESGYGLFIVNQLVDDLEYSPATPRGNHWHLVKIVQEEDQ